MMHPKAKALTILHVCALTVGASLLAAGGGCKKEEAPAQVVAPRPAAPAAPRWTIADLDMDPRVQFPDRAKPASEGLAQAAADFATALITGDQDAFGAMLSPDAKAVLTALKDSGDWAPATEELRAVRVCRIEETGESPVLALGIEDDFGATLLAWYIEGSEGSWVFSPMAIDAPWAERVAMLDDAPLDPPLFDSGSASEAPIVVNLPDEKEDDKKPGRRGRPGPSRRPAPSGPSIPVPN